MSLDSRVGKVAYTALAAAGAFSLINFLNLNSEHAAETVAEACKVVGGDYGRIASGLSALGYAATRFSDFLAAGGLVYGGYRSIRRHRD